MKVLFISRGPSPYRVDFFNELGKLCDLTVLFEMHPCEISDRNEKWFHEDYNCFKGIYLKKSKLKLKNNNFCPEIIKYLKMHKKFNIIVVGMYSTPTQMLALMYMKLKKIPYLLNSDGGFVKNENKFIKLIKKFFISGAAGYLSTGIGTTKYLKHYGAKSKIYIYPFTTYKIEDLPKNETSDELKNKLRKKLNIKEKYVVLAVGQFIYRKGFDILLKSVEKIDIDLGVYIVGGEPTEEYIKLKNDLNLKNVHFIGFKDKKELSEFYRVADTFVLPTREDIWGLVINEAMAFGLPVITTTNCLAGLELIENDVNGFLIPIDSVTELRNNLINLFENQEHMRKMGHLNFIKMKNYTIEKMAEANKNAFEDFLSRY